MRYILILTLILDVLATQASEPMTMEAAKEWCDTMVLTPVEGIWEYPEDGAKVLIRADKCAPGTFTMEIIQTADCRLERGDIIGRLHSTADDRRFRLEQMTRKESGHLYGSQECAATLSSDGESLRVKGKKIKLKIQPYTLLPRFWRIVRISEKNPVEDLPAGLIKLYPGYDHNGSLKRKPRIL